MALPRISQPTYPIFLRSINKKTTFRPFTVAEEKILLHIRDSEDVAATSVQIKTLIKNCIQEDISVGDLSMYDIELLLIKLRAKSVGELVEVSYTDDDGKKHNVEINLEEIELTVPERETKIEVTEDIGIIMRDPSYDDIVESQNSNKEGTDATWDVIMKCIDTIYTKDDSFKNDGIGFSKEDLDEFVDRLPSKVSAKLFEYFDKMPKVKVEFTLKDGTKRTIEGLNNFLAF